MSRQPNSDTVLDAVIAATEDPIRSPWTTDLAVMRVKHERLAELGLLAPDEPTPWSHYLARQQETREFSPEERALIRTVLGLR